jgi:TonB family protein
VFDPSGARVPGAVVMLINQGTHQDWGATTDDTGLFSFSQLPPGDYKLKVTRPGFAVYEWADRLDHVSPSPKLDIVLEPGAVMETVDVSAKAPEDIASRSGNHGPQRIRVGSLVQAPKLIERTEPQYPEEARAKGIQGIVLLRAVISMDGRPIGLKVLSSPDGELSKAAMDSVSRWRYEPTLLNGEPIEVATTLAVRFHLEKRR